MATLAERARQRTKARGMPCSMCAFLASVDGDTLTEVAEALVDPTISDRALHEELIDAGYTAPALQQIGHHRRGSCNGRAS